MDTDVPQRAEMGWLVMSVAMRAAMILGLMALGGCVAMGPRFSPAPESPANHGVVYVYRLSRFANIAVSPGVKVDGREYAALPSGGYMPFTLEEGEHSIALVLSDKYWGQARVRVSVKAGAESYVRLDTSNETHGSTMTHLFQLSAVTRDMANGEIWDCKLVDPEKGERFSTGIFTD